MKFILAVLLLFSLKNTFSQTSSFIQYKDTVNNFTIKIPVGWRYGLNKNFPSLKLVATSIATDTANKSNENFNLNILIKKNSSLEKEYGNLVGALSSTKDFTLSKKGNATINGQSYKWFIETHKNNINSLLMANYVFITYKNEKTYILTFVSYSKYFDKYETLFTEIANSLIL